MPGTGEASASELRGGRDRGAFVLPGLAGWAQQDSEGRGWQLFWRSESGLGSRQRDSKDNHCYVCFSKTLLTLAEA